MQQSKNIYMLFWCQWNNHNFYLLLVSSRRQRTKRKHLLIPTLSLRFFQQYNPHTAARTLYMFRFRLDEGIFVKCFLNGRLLFSPSGNNSASHWLHAPAQPARSFSSLPLKALPGSLTANMQGTPSPFCDGQWSWKLSAARFVQASHYEHYNHCPSTIHSKGTVIVKNNSQLPKKIPPKCSSIFEKILGWMLSRFNVFLLH